MLGSPAKRLLRERELRFDGPVFLTTGPSVRGSRAPALLTGDRDNLPPPPTLGTTYRHGQ